MVINADTEIRHDVLGAIRYDNGQSLKDDADHYSATSPMWVARPGGWDTGLEFYLACGNKDLPCQLSLQRAVRISADHKKIVTTACEMTSQELDVAWFDCTGSVATVALSDARDGYILWIAVLEAQNNITKITEGSW